MEKQIHDMVERYRRAIQTQEADDFLPLWDPAARCTLISPSGFYVGLDAIYQEFLLGGIRRAYSRIELQVKSVQVRLLGQDGALVLFAYATDCERRETGEPFGISGLETQIYHRLGDDWRLVHVHYSIQPEA